MRTTYLTSLTTSFNPFSSTSQVPRLFLQLLPTTAHRSIKISQTVLPRTSTKPASLELGFKDGKNMKFSWTETTKLAVEGGAKQTKEVQGVRLTEIVEEVERHARILGRKEELSG